MSVLLALLIGKTYPRMDGLSSQINPGSGTCLGENPREGDAMVKIDSIDRRILEELQHDAARPIEQIASRVGLTQNPCWRRIKRLEAVGVIQRRVAIVDAARLGIGLTVFVSIRTNQHNESWLERFASGVRKIPEVVELYRMSGDTDYLLKVLARDVADYDRIYKQLIRVAELHDVSSSFAMEQIKYTTEVPLGGVAEGYGVRS